MANSPIQIVLNSGDFIAAWDRPPGGSHKDFYEGRDAEFAVHKSNISSQLDSIKKDQLVNKYSRISYAKVILKPSAIAKSHRPTTALFKQSASAIVGGGQLGEMYVELEPTTIDKITSKVEEAEPETRLKFSKSKGKDVASPSPTRSEVGAIDKIIPYNVSDRRNFSVSEGLKWLSQPETGGAYIVELFELPPQRKDWDNLSREKYRLFNSFVEGLNNIGIGLVVSRIFDSSNNVPMLSVRIENTKTPASIQFVPKQSALKKRYNSYPSPDLNSGKHSRLIHFLDDHPLIRKIILPPIIQKAQAKSASPLKSMYAVPKPAKGKKYPKIGIVDGGVSTIYNEWITIRWNFLHDSDKDEEHATFIAGLLVSGNALNGNDICKELDGCTILDLDLLPKDGSYDKYYVDPDDFFKELEQAVIELKAQYGVRIFNFSLNVRQHVSADSYSLPAQYLDKIAEENDVIFIISAGNMDPINHRREWPADPVEALKILAVSKHDIIMTPAESYRNLSVSAVNPPELKNIVPFALSKYSCRGPGIQVGLKPDLAHVGGSGTRDGLKGHGLLSINPEGTIIDSCGTSYAVPNVAKTVACLENDIEGHVSRESLMALAIHHAFLPKVFNTKELKTIAKDLIGFGIPKSSEEILSGDDHSITLVFANRIYPGKRMSFNFSWPACLVKNGKCSGFARLTIVSTPPFNYRFGSEFVRVNIEGNLRQLQKDGISYVGKLKPIYYSEDETEGMLEKSLIENSFKWSPVKVLEKKFRGVGESSEWKLEIEYVERDREKVPMSGIPFTAILTISDPNKEEPVFTDMHQKLQSMGLQIFDIKVAARNAIRT